MRSDWLDSATGDAVLREEARQAAVAFESIFGDQFLQIGRWGNPAIFRRFARTRRYAVVDARPAPGVDLVCRPHDLAIAADSIDAVFLPHSLERADDPHGVLREVDRVLRPDGHVVIAGFNAWGWWGLRHYLSRRRFPAGGQRLISEVRLRDWLHLLDYRVLPACFHHMAAPLYRSRGPLDPGPPDLLQGQGPVTGTADPTDPPPRSRRWHPLASCYLVVASREIFPMTPIRPAFRRRPQLVGSLVNPTTRNAA